jgi:hypothetical protein
LSANGQPKASKAIFTSALFSDCSTETNRRLNLVATAQEKAGYLLIDLISSTPSSQNLSFAHGVTSLEDRIGLNKSLLDYIAKKYSISTDQSYEEESRFTRRDLFDQ